MDDRKILENEFNRAMLRIYEREKKECQYPAAQFAEMISKYGGLRAAKFLINSARASYGFNKLCQRNRPDLTVEAEILKPEWKELFTDVERKIARNRLEDRRYEHKDDQIAKKQEAGFIPQETQRDLRSSDRIGTRKKDDYPIRDWNRAKKQAKSILIERAKMCKVITYTNLVRKIRAIQLYEGSSAMITMLREISEEEDNAGHGMLSVLVVRKCSDGLPGPGFFVLAKQLNRITFNKRKCWRKEFDKVCNYWKKY